MACTTRGRATQPTAKRTSIFTTFYLRQYTRYLGPTHNDLGDSAVPMSCLKDPAAEHNGLTDFGRAVVSRANELGIIVDISHAAMTTAMDAIRASRAPVIASHSSIDHVGMASDFNGGGGIAGWDNARDTLNVTVELVRRGYREEQIAQLWGGNLLRVMEEVEAAARRRE